VRSGVVASLGRPGGNVTGVTLISSELAGKRLELLRETVPGLSHVGILWNAANPDRAFDFAQMQVAARLLKVEVQSLEIRDANALEGAFQAAGRGRVGGLIPLHDALIMGQRTRIADLAAKSRLPALYESSEYVKAGGLMGYGPNYRATYRRVAYYVDRILKGTKPADLPVEQPMRFELVINMKTAKALGLTLPPSIMVRADQVIG